MSKTSWYLGFGASDSLFALNSDFRRAVEQGTEQQQIDALQRLLNLFADECLNQYFVYPLEQVKLSGVAQKIVAGGVSAMKKTIHLTVRQVVKKMSAADRSHMADYINSLLKPLRESSRFPAYVAVEVSDDLRERLRLAAEQGTEQGGSVVAGDYTNALCELVDVALHSYMEKPLGMMKLGRIMNKVTTVAADAIRGAAHTVIRKVVPTMSDREMEGFFAFSESILYPHPA